MIDIFGGSSELFGNNLYHSEIFEIIQVILENLKRVQMIFGSFWDVFNKCNDMGHFPILCGTAPDNLTCTPKVSPDNMHMVNQVLETKHNFCPPFVGGATTCTCFNTSVGEPASILKPFHPSNDVISSSRYKASS